MSKRKIPLMKEKGFRNIAYSIFIFYKELSLLYQQLC